MIGVLASIRKENLPGANLENYHYANTLDISKLHLVINCIYILYLSGEVVKSYKTQDEEQYTHTHTHTYTYILCVLIIKLYFAMVNFLEYAFPLL
jgi:hypothetical protein